MTVARAPKIPSWTKFAADFASEKLHCSLDRRTEAPTLSPPILTKPAQLRHRTGFRGTKEVPANGTAQEDQPESPVTAHRSGPKTYTSIPSNLSQQAQAIWGKGCWRLCRGQKRSLKRKPFLQLPFWLRCVSMRQYKVH
ncbi:hypothetical protein BGZ63DRAFT_393926 [Mariannaea sp. PMI_226]|nr:hypothetical protein BGZ63DRAFT_393926 [Mariannaea sp. PMI_226]